MYPKNRVNQKGPEGCTTTHFCKDYISGPTSAIKNQQRIFLTRFWTEVNNRSVYIRLSSGRPVFVIMLIRDTNIIKNTVLEQILCKYSISGLTFTIRNQQSLLPDAFWTEDKYRSIILVLHFPLIWKSSGDLNHHHRHQYCQEYCIWTSFT